MWGLSRRPTRVLNVCDLSSPTRIKSQRSHLSHIGGTVTPPCPVTTRSSVPGSTAQATSPGFLLLPPHQLWCQKDARAKLVPELEAPPPPSVTCNLSPPMTGVTRVFAISSPHVWIPFLSQHKQSPLACLLFYLRDCCDRPYLGVLCFTRLAVCSALLPLPNNVVWICRTSRPTLAWVAAQQTHKLYHFVKHLLNISAVSSQLIFSIHSVSHKDQLECCKFAYSCVHVVCPCCLSPPQLSPSFPLPTSFTSVQQPHAGSLWVFWSFNTRSRFLSQTSAQERCHPPLCVVCSLVLPPSFYICTLFKMRAAVGFISAGEVKGQGWVNPSHNVHLSQMCRIWVWPVLLCDNCKALKEFYVSFKESLCEGIAFDSPEDTGGCDRFWAKVTLYL